MAQIHESIAAFLTALTSELQVLVPQATLSWTPRGENTSRAEWVWWSCGLSVDPDCRFAAGAPEHTWEQLGATEEERFAALGQAMQQAAQLRFGSEVSCTDPGPAEEPSTEWSTVTVNVTVGEIEYPAMEFALNPAFETLFGAAVVEPEPGPEPQGPNPTAVDMLMHVEIPVSVLLGRTQMRMRDLLALSHGSIVELDQELSDEVEIRVSNCTIARGEVVAVDGNYGVRILKMLPGRNASAAQNALIGGGSTS